MQVNFEKPFSNWMFMHIDNVSICLSAVPNDPLEELVSGLVNCLAYGDGKADMHSGAYHYVVYFSPLSTSVYLRENRSETLCVEVKENIGLVALQFKEALLKWGSDRKNGSNQEWKRPFPNLAPLTRFLNNLS